MKRFKNEFGENYKKWIDSIVSDGTPVALGVDIVKRKISHREYFRAVVKLFQYGETPSAIQCAAESDDFTSDNKEKIYSDLRSLLENFMEHFINLGKPIEERKSLPKITLPKEEDEYRKKTRDV